MATGTGLSAPGSPKPSSTVSTIACRSTTAFSASRTLTSSNGLVSTQNEIVIEFDAAGFQQHDRRIVLQRRNDRWIDVQHQIDLAGLDRRHGGDRFLRDRDLDAFCLRLAGIPVVRVLAQDAHRRIRRELLLHEGAGAVAMEPQIFLLGAVGHDVGELVADEHRQLHHRLLGGERHRVRIRRLDAVRIEELEHGAGAGSSLLVQQALEAVDHVGGGEVLAAVEFDAIAQLEGPGQAVIRHAPFGRQLRQDVEVVVDIDQAVVDRERVIGIVAGMHVGGIHRLLLAAPLVSQHLHAFVARGRERRARQPRHRERADRRAAHQSCQFHRYLPALVVTLRLPSVPRQIPECWTVVRIYRMVG